MSGPLLARLPIGVRRKDSGLVHNHRWYCSADTVAWNANSWQRYPWHAEKWWEPLLYCVWQMNNSIGSVHSGVLTDCCSWTMFFIKVPSTWGLFTTICVLTSHQVMSSTAPSAWAPEAGPDQQVPRWWTWHERFFLIRTCGVWHFITKIITQNKQISIIQSL